MTKPLDLINKKFGRLLVISREPSKKFKTSYFTMFKCICDCGNLYITYGSSLNKGKVLSCGCLKIEKAKKPKGEAGFNDLYGEYKKRSIKSNREFSLSKDEFRKLTKDLCFYCGDVPRNEHIPHHSRSIASREHEKYIYNGVDRVDSSKGYNINNCVTCCKLCNIAKHNLSKMEFYSRIQRIYTYLKNKGEISEP